MKCSTIQGNIPHAETLYDTVRFYLSYILQGLFIFRYSKCWNNDLVSHFKIVDICPIEVFIRIWHIKKHFYYLESDSL